MSNISVPKEMFLTKGLGRHKEKLASFEEALRDAKIARYNLVHVSSIFPPFCRVIPPAPERAWSKLRDGQIVHWRAEPDTVNENHRLIASFRRAWRYRADPSAPTDI